MLPQTPHPQMLLGRIRSTRERLARQVWEESPPFETKLSWLEAPANQLLTASEAAEQTFKAVTQFPHAWGPRFAQAWFRFTLPEALVADYPYLRWEDDGESTLYADGIPYAGFDCEHRYWRLPESGTDLLMESVAVSKGINWYPPGVRSPIGPEGSVLHPPRLFRRNEDAWQAWIDLQLLEELIRILLAEKNPEFLHSFSGKKHLLPMHHLSPLLRKLIAAANNAIDTAELAGIPAMRSALAKAIRQFPAATHQLKATLTGHAHVDLVWLWPERVGVAKALHTFASMDRLMDAYPEFQFGYSQPASYRAVKEQSPELFARIQKRIEEGRWEATGALEVESDTNLSCGEGLVRSLLLGQDGFQELRGQSASVVWLPDVFGYAGYLPQLMKEAGVRYFYTQKVTWNNLHRFPFSCFRWRGIDGSEVVGHVMLSEIDSCYNGRTDLDHLRDIEQTQQQAAIFNEVLIPTGFGDGGGGTTELMCERARRLADLAEMPRLQWGNIEEFFDRLNQVSPKLPVWSGEIYLEYHRGVQTTHHRLKAAFRGLERALQQFEAAQVATGKRQSCLHTWHRLVFAQFHDYIPGSSVPEVYAEAIPELESLAEKTASDTIALLSSGEEIGPEAFFNPHAHAVQHRFEKAGKSLCLEIPPVSGRPVSAACALPPDSAVQGDSNHLSNQRVNAEFLPDATIKALVIDGHPIHFTQPAGAVLQFVDRPVNFPAWDLERYSLTHGSLVNQECKPEFSCSSELSASLSYHFEFGAGNQLTVRYTLKADEPFLRVSYRVTLTENEVLLKVVFPTSYAGGHARFGSGFGSVLRPQSGDSLQTDAQFEVPASRWALVADDDESHGLWLVSRDLYGFGARDGLLHLSLVRSALVSDPNLELLNRNVEQEPVFSDLEPLQLEIAIGRAGASTPATEHPALLAETLFTEPVAYQGGSIDSPLLGIDGLPSLIPAWVLPSKSDGGFILRLHEVRGARGEATLRLAPGWVAQAVDIRENVLAPENGPTFQIRPYQVISLRIWSE